MNQSDIWRVTPVEVPIEVTFLVLMCVVGTFGNILTFTGTFRSKKLRTPLHLILAIAMVADLVICGIDLPFIIYGTILGRWDLPYILCSFIGVLLYIAAGASLLLSVVIAFNRLLGCFPANRVCQKLSKTKATIFGIIGALVYDFALLSPIIVGYISVDYLVPYGACLITNDNPMNVLVDYVTALGALGAYSCVTITALIYLIIFIRLRTQSVNFGVNKKRATYIKGTRNMALLFIFYVLCWSPDIIHNNVDVTLKAPVWVTRYIFNFCINNVILNSCFIIIMLDKLYCQNKHATIEYLIYSMKIPLTTTVIAFYLCFLSG